MIDATPILWILGAIAAFVALGFGAGKLGKAKQLKKRWFPAEPPRDIAADVARDAIQRSFEEDVDAVERARTGDDPAQDLADLGNARRRR